jgi:hypothetical protein
VRAQELVDAQLALLGSQCRGNKFDNGTSDLREWASARLNELLRPKYIASYAVRDD